MAIQMRRGVFTNFDPTRLLPGEWAVVLSGDDTATDGRTVYICFAAGTVKRMATYEDMVSQIANASDEVVAEVVADVAADLLAATEAAETATENADVATGRANSAADEAEAFLNGFVVQYENLSDECKALIAQSAGTGAEVISDDEGIAIIDSLTPLIISGHDSGTITDVEGLAIIDGIFG